VSMAWTFAVGLCQRDVLRMAAVERYRHTITFPEPFSLQRKISIILLSNVYRSFLQRPAQPSFLVQLSVSWSDILLLLLVLPFPFLQFLDSNKGSRKGSNQRKHRKVCRLILILSHCCRSRISGLGRVESTATRIEGKVTFKYLLRTCN
jgi:hypothetical protein